MARDPLRSCQAGPVARLWTIGYERLLPEALVAELRAAGVRRVIDVRFRPQSRRPGMSKTRLGALLAEHGIAYEHAVTGAWSPRRWRAAAPSWPSSTCSQPAGQ